MHFGFTEDQVSVRDAVASFLSKSCPVEVVVSAFTEGGASSQRGLWSSLASMGVFGLLAPEDAGGSALDTVTMALVLAETGRFAVPLPVLETALLGVPALLGTALVEQVVDGSLVVTATPSREVPAPACGMADLFVVGGVVFERDEVSIEPLVSVDRTRDLGLLTPKVAGHPRSEDPARFFDLGSLGSAAQLLGLGRSLVDQSVAYVKERRQFGVPIGSFQAVKHQLANAHLAMEFAAPAVWAAAHLIDVASPDAPQAVSTAKALASDAAQLASRVALQCHGAMGYTDDYHLHLWLKRVWCVAASWGTAAWHRDRVGRFLGI